MKIGKKHEKQTSPLDPCLVMVGLIYYFSESPKFTGENTTKVIKEVINFQPVQVTINHHEGFSFPWN